MATPLPIQLRNISDERIAFLIDESDRFATALNAVADALRMEAVDLLSSFTLANASRAAAIVDLQRSLQAQLNRLGYERTVVTFVSGYDASQKFAIEALAALGIKPNRLSPIDENALAALKKNDYTYLVGVGGSTVQAIATGVVQNTLTKTPRSRIIDNIASTLDLKLRSQAASYADTALISYDRRTAMEHWVAAGIKQYLYRGPKDIKNRPFCQKHVGKVFTLDEIRALDMELEKYSKNPLLPCIYFGGGWGCRHTWSPVTEQSAGRRGGSRP